MSSFFNRISAHPPSACAFIILIGLFIFFWDLGSKNLFGEEGRRALCAQYYIETGTYFVPDVHGEPYLNKPPGYPWLIVLSSKIFGGINEWSVRFPSACFSVITALLIFFFSHKHIPPQIRFLSALTFFTMFEVAMKGRMGETDASLMCFGFAAIWCWWQGFQSNKYGWFITAGIMLSSALLMKGPPAVIFFYGAVLPYCITQGKSKWLLSIQHAVFLSTVFFATCLWLVPFLQDISTETLAETSSRELLRGDEFSIQNTVMDQLSFSIGSLMAFLPCSVFVFFWCSKRIRNQHEPYFQEALLFIGMIVTGFTFFILFPETRVRYILPLAPPLSLITGMILFQTNPKLSAKWGNRTISFFWLTCCVITTCGIFWGVFRLTQPFPNWITPLFILILSAWLLYHLYRGKKQKYEFPILCIQIISVVLLMFVINYEKIYEHNLKTPIKQLAQNARQTLGNQTIYINYEGGFNFFYYLGTPIQRIDDLREIPSEKSQVILGYLTSLDELDETMDLKSYGWKIQSTQSVALKDNLNLYFSTLVPIK